MATEALKVEFDLSEYVGAGHRSPDGSVVGSWSFCLRPDPTWPEDVMRATGSFDEACAEIVRLLGDQKRRKAKPYSLYYSGRTGWCYVWLLP